MKIEKCPKCGEEMHEAREELTFVYGSKIKSGTEETFLVCDKCGYGKKKEETRDR